MSGIRRSIGERIFDTCNVIFFIILGILMIFPMWNVFTTSLVELGEFTARPFILWPKKLVLYSYQFLFSSERVVNSIGVSVFITVGGIIWSMFLTCQIAYGLSKSHLIGRKFFLVILLITMFFGGGLIPTYLWIKQLGLMNTLWVMFIPTGVGVWNFAVMRAFFSQLPQELEESAKLDGASDLLIFYRIILPLSKPLLATFALFFGVGYWNSWYSALLYVTDYNKWPLALVLRQMVVSSSLPAEIHRVRSAGTLGQSVIFYEGVNAAGIIIATIPILLVYPWLQKYFAKGVMIGSIKG